MNRFVVKELDPATWELFVDGGQTGQYTTPEKAKAAARRFLRTNEGLEWCQAKDGSLKGFVLAKRYAVRQRSS